MSPEAQRIIIAEVCGWKFRPPFKEFELTLENKAEALACWSAPGNDFWQTEIPPDYLNDLNAIHEAEKLLTGEQRIDYLEHLREQTGCYADATYATAYQRAEAFLRTLGKWVEPQEPAPAAS